MKEENRAQNGMYVCMYVMIIIVSLGYRPSSPLSAKDHTI